MSAEAAIGNVGQSGLAHSLDGHIQVIGDIRTMVNEIEDGLFGQDETAPVGVEPPVQSGLSHSVAALANELHQLRDRLQNLHGRVVGGGTC